MRQLLYTSTSTAEPGKAEINRILEQSRHNNAIDGVTGLLWTDGTRFLQVLEGSDDSVIAAFQRIAIDPRHADIDLVLDRTIGAREFGGWSMAERSNRGSADEFDARLRRLLLGASPSVREAFLETMVPA